MPRERIPPSKVERGPSNEIVCSIADHITTNIPFTCYHLYGRNLQTKRHEHASGEQNLHYLISLQWSRCSV